MPRPKPERQKVPFTPVDETFIHMDSLRHPNNVHVEVRAPGKLDAERLREAVLNAIELHRMTWVQLADDPEEPDKLEWEVNENPQDPLLVVEVSDDADLQRCRNKFVSIAPDITQAPPLIVWLVRHPEGDAVMFNFHHAAADGMASIRFMQSVTRSYAGEEDPIAGPDELEVRNEKLVFDSAEVSTADRIKQMAIIAKGMSGKPAPIYAKDPDFQAGYTCSLLKLAEKDFKKLDYKQFDATFNDLAIAAMHKTVEQWNKGNKQDSETIRIPVPANLRPAEWARDVMGNYFNAFMTNTTQADRKSQKKLMQAVVSQTRQGKQYKIAEVLYTGINEGSRMPAKFRKLILKSMVGVQACSATCTNLGRIPEIISFGDHGDATEVILTGPAPWPVATILGITSYGGKLFLSFRFCRDMLNQESGDEFAKLYLETLSWLGKKQ